MKGKDEADVPRKAPENLFEKQRLLFLPIIVLKGIFLQMFQLLRKASKEANQPQKFFWCYVNELHYGHVNLCISYSEMQKVYW